jgi:hypothetical protein
MQAIGFSPWRDTAAGLYLALATVGVTAVLATATFFGA